MFCIESKCRIVRWSLAVACVVAVVGCSTPAPSTTRALTATARNWDEYRMQAARRIVASNPQVSHTGSVQQPSLAIPVLEVELNADGSVRNISVMREPSQAKDTTGIAIDAVRRAAPFGDVSGLPRPWRFSEAFLFNDDRRFKPRSLD